MRHIYFAASLTFWSMSASAVTVQVDAGANRLSINPYIYGVSFASAADITALNLKVNRWGGNFTSTYSYANNAQNLAGDNYFVSSACYIYEASGACNPYALRGSATAGEEADTFVRLNKTAGADPLLTVPMIGYVAKLNADRSPLWSFPVSAYGPQCSTDPNNKDAGDGRQPEAGFTHAQCLNINTTDPVVPWTDASVRGRAYVTDTVTAESAWIKHLVATWGTADKGGVHYYLMDNEPSVWFATHPDIAPIGLHATDARDRVIQTAAMIRGVDPAAKIVGPEEWGWGALPYSGYDQQNADGLNWDISKFADYHGATQQNGMYYIPWLLSQWKASHAIDVFSFHYWPQGGEFGDLDAACANTNPATAPKADSAAMQVLRNQSTRELWDKTYVSQTYIAQAPYFIARIKEMLSTYYVAGTPLAITEYNWGDENCMNGATAQADIFGIFGVQGLDAAMRWAVPAPTTPTYQVMKLYRNYDGAGGAFGDVSVSASAPNADQLAAFAATRSSDGALTVMVINKTTADTPVTLQLANFTAGASAARYRVSASSPSAIQHAANVTVSGGAVTDTAPAQSVTIYVVPKQ